MQPKLSYLLRAVAILAVFASMEFRPSLKTRPERSTVWSRTKTMQ